MELKEMALAIVILGIVAAIGSVVLIGVRDTQTANLPTYAVANESITSTTAGVLSSTGWCKTVDTCINTTGHEAIASGNYTYSVDPASGLCLIKNATATMGNTWDCTYTVYNQTDVRFALPNSASVGLGEYGSWFKILVIVAVAAAVLGLIFMAFGARGKGGSSEGSAY